MSRPGTKSNVLKKSLWKTTLIENRSSRKSNWPQRTKIMTAFPIFNWSWAKRWKGSIACTKPINATSWIKKRISRQNWMLKPLNSAFFYFGLMTQVFWNCFPKWKSPSFPIKWWWFFYAPVICMRSIFRVLALFNARLYTNWWSISVFPFKIKGFSRWLLLIVAESMIYNFNIS